MQNIISDSWHIHRSKLRKFFHTIVSQELLNLSEPCYAPKLKKYEDLLYSFLDISKTDMQERIKDFYKGTPAEKWLLENDTTTNLLVLILHFFLNNNDMLGFRTAMLFYNIRQYSNLFHRNFTFCQPDIFKYTLENMSKSHIYSREKTISNAVYHFSNQMVNRWKVPLKKLDNPMMVSKFVRECRHRHAQSIKSFTISYYENAEAGNRIKQQKEEITNKETGDSTKVELSQRTPTKIIELVEKMTIHRFADIKALENSLKINNINKIYGQLIVKEINKSSNHELLLVIYKSYISHLSSINDLCSNKFIIETKSLIRSKNTKVKFFKESCLELLDKCLKDAKLDKDYKKLSQQSKYTYLNFIIFYLTWSLKNYVC